MALVGYYPRVFHDIAALFVGTPHERYAARLRWSTPSPAAAALWLAAAEGSLRDATQVALPHRGRHRFASDAPAAAYAMPLRRGQRFVARVERRGRVPFFDLFERDGSDFRRVASAARGEAHIEVEIEEDGDYVLRLQPELGFEVSLSVAQHVEPTLRLPVDGVIRSLFGAARDGGRRRHEGIDIFARRGAPVVAAADGFVSAVTTNRLGGNVVWVVRPLRGEAHYYAHLDRQLVRPGARIKAGEVIGTVGNTGNARGTPPHLHFGIYAAGGAIDPLPFVAAAEERADD